MFGQDATTCVNQGIKRLKYSVPSTGSLTDSLFWHFEKFENVLLCLALWSRGCQECKACNGWTPTPVASRLDSVCVYFVILSAQMCKTPVKM